MDFENTKIYAKCYQITEKLRLKNVKKEIESVTVK